MLTIGSCFSGIGGLELGLEWTGGFETKWQIEMDKYATKVLEKHWPNVKRYTDIRDVVRPPVVDVICGGFPCQDVSIATKKKGLKGKRTTLWSEMHRIICEVKPRWVLAENVPGLLSSDDGRFFGNILRDLASAGYDAEWGVLSAAGVGAPHLRQRLFIVANPNGFRWNCLDESKENGRSKINIEMFKAWRNAKDRLHLSMVSAKSDPSSGTIRNDDGLSVGMDRLRCLGNAVVPQVAQKIGEMILKYDGLA